MGTSDIFSKTDVDAPFPAGRTTPLRELPLERFHGCRVLSQRQDEYRDGAEERVLEIISTAADRSSTSDELGAQAHTWPERYHLDPARANVLRPLTWSSNMSILEIGAGCGAITRFLAESGALVDALEPTPSRARCTRQRTDGLPDVEVFIGDTTDVPMTASYDAVVLVGVLEYVAHGRSQRSEYVDFLRMAAALVRKGGNIVLAIENRLGVKYLCGAPEDHSGRPFDSVEGYPGLTPARTFCRREIEALLRDVGMTPTVFGVFPDYKLSRLVCGDRLLEMRPDLARRIPQFPSPDWQPVAPPRVADEARVWANLVESGLGPETANSFLVVAGSGDASTSPWPPDLLATYYPPAGRRAAYSLETSIVQSDGTLVFKRRALRERPVDGTVDLTVESTELVEGDDLLERMATSRDDRELAGLLDQWMAALEQALAAGALPDLDLLPHNAVLGSDGSLTFVDAKYQIAGVTRDEIIERAALVCGLRLAWRTSPERWPVLTVEGLVLHLGGLLGLPPGGRWLVAAIDREAAFSGQVTLSSASGLGAVAQQRRNLELELARPLAECRSVRPGPAVNSDIFEKEIAKAAELIKTTGEALVAESVRAIDAEERLAAQSARIIDVENALGVAEAEAAALRRTKTFRYTEKARQVYGGLRKTARIARPNG
jgi:2-polyprenyl-3-methyl-5-hydroxy-6-metoxy-1,4-benzoquinol methylase